jgi:small GTP-binding protein
LGCLSLNVDRCLGEEEKVEVWDTAGQEVYRSMAPIYCRNAQAAMLVYDVTKADTFASLGAWIEILRQSSDVPFIVVSNKTDLEKDREVALDDGAAFASARRAPFFETSAVLDAFVKEAFVQLTVMGLWHAKARGKAAGECRQGIPELASQKCCSKS